MALKPGQPTGQGKGGFVICEICDGYIKDLEQLRNHMQWIHKVINFRIVNCQVLIKVLLQLLFHIFISTKDFLKL